MSSIGAFQMSSRKPVSTARPHRFWSIEYGDLCDTSIGRPFSSGSAIALSRVQAKSRAGAITRRSGASEPRPTSKRTWSLPLPVQPCETIVPPCWRGGANRGGGGGRGRRGAGARHQGPDDERPRQRGDQRVPVHVERVGPQRRDAEVGGELVAGVHDLGLDRAAVQRPLADVVHVL